MKGVEKLCSVLLEITLLDVDASDSFEGPANDLLYLRRAFFANFILRCLNLVMRIGIAFFDHRIDRGIAHARRQTTDAEGKLECRQ